ncbi:hypothetical protein OND84_000729 [Morganella morganii]|nr:hypothetical protein [Morganella morganii]
MTASVLRTETENAVQTAFSHDVTPLSLTTRQCFSDLQEAPSGNRSHYQGFSGERRQVQHSVTWVTASAVPSDAARKTRTCADMYGRSAVLTL